MEQRPPGTDGNTARFLIGVQVLGLFQQKGGNKTNSLLWIGFVFCQSIRMCYTGFAESAHYRTRGAEWRG